MEEDDVKSGSRPIVKTGRRKRINTTEMAADPPREPKGGYEGSRFNAVRHGVLSELTVLTWEGEARTKPPISHDALLQWFNIWVAEGAPCPSSQYLTPRG